MFANLFREEEMIENVYQGDIFLSNGDFPDDFIKRGSAIGAPRDGDLDKSVA